MSRTKSWMLYRLEHVLGFVYQQVLDEDRSHEVEVTEEDIDEGLIEKKYKRVQVDRKDKLTTSEVSKALKISVPVLERWLRDPIFQENQVAVKEGSRWMWHRYKTTVWVIAAMKLDPKKRPARIVAENPAFDTDSPPQRRLPNLQGRFYKDITLSLNYVRAREQLRMPLDYTFGKHSD